MSKLPIAGPESEGRTFGTDWSIANVVKLLRSNAGRGVWRQIVPVGGSMARINQNYLRTVSARHMPTGVSVIFMQLETPNHWYASLYFTKGWNEGVAALWLNGLFDGAPYEKMEAESLCAWVSSPRSLPLQ